MLARVATFARLPEGFDNAAVRLRRDAVMA
jgi:hypothetical protein